MSATKPVITFPKRNCVHIAAVEPAIQDCTYCSQKHNIKSCKDFKLLSVNERWRWVREVKICFRCLKKGAHRWNACKAKRCGVDGCNRRHHSLLHGDMPSLNAATSGAATSTNSACLYATTPATIAIQQSQVAPDSAVEEQREYGSNIVPNLKVTSCNVSDSALSRTYSRAFLKVLPVVVRGPAGEYSTYALLDDGSTATLLDADVAKQIGAEEIHRESITIEGIGGMLKHTDVGYIQFYIRGRDLSQEYLISNARSISSLNLCSQTISKSDISKYRHLANLIDILPYESAKPTILIGAGDWHLTIAREARYGRASEPVATRTLLGWTLHGSMSTKCQPVDFVNYVTSDTEFDTIEALMREQYRLDCLGISKLPPKNSEEIQRAIDIIDNSARRLSSGRFEVGLPWNICKLTNIPDSYHQALSRFKLLEKQFIKDRDFASAYTDFINGIINKGYAEECLPESYRYKTANTSVGTDSIRWYLPHFGVYHPQKKKLRVVHDAAAVSRGVSLNSLLLVGPDLLQSLLGILYRFREGRIAVTADIREMFPQIRIRESDRDAQRFLWRDYSSVKSPSPIKEYRMASMIFGAICSPFIALHIKNKNALELQNSYPEATNEIIQNHYQDDYITSFDSVDVASKVVLDVYTVHKACCFEMRAWLSNDTRAITSVPKDLWAFPGTETTLPGDVSALGIKWDPAKDTLGFRVGCLDISDKKTTKRTILSSVMKVYDPLGFLSPVTIKGRILIQELWREGLGWDDELSLKYTELWKKWLAEVAALKECRISRWYSADPLQLSDTQLHMFSDASEQAYACVAYWRFTFADGHVKLSLIGSKARVTPLKPCTIPRLELQAALISVRLAKTIKDGHRMKPSSTVFWTDSTTILRWLRGDARRYKPFVAHRIGEILENSNPTDWRWISSAQNVSDDATRTNTDLLTDVTHRWFTGPSFLLDPPEEWPVDLPMSESAPLPDLKEVVGFLTNNLIQGPPVPDPSRFSVWLRLLRATACVILGARMFRSFLGPINNPNSKLNSNTTSITVSDIEFAERLLLINSQIESFAEEITLLKAQKPLPRSSKLALLSPVLSEDGLLKIQTRIKSAMGVTESAKSLIILDGRQPIVRLIIRHFHCRAGHAFHELVLNELRQKFWILRCRSSIKSIAYDCFHCRRLKAKPNIPPTGDLPPERLEHHQRCFTNVGLDYFGPVLITIGRRHEKRYVALYTCLVSRAVHLEVVHSLSTDSAIMSLRRFIARRGCPRTIYSDNGTAFISASRELSELFGTSVSQFATNNRIQWKFIPPASPFMGGAWERMVRSVKVALYATLKDKAPKEEVFLTFLMEAEAIINSRPLTFIPVSTDSPEAITPFHFILGTSSIHNWLPSQLDDADLIRHCDWKKTLRLADHFWSRWVKEYLPTMIPRRSQSTASSSSLKPGDIVVLADPTLPRAVWPLGKVLKIFHGPDGEIRVADVETKGGVLRRPVRKLVPLVDDTQQDSHVATQ